MIGEPKVHARMSPSASHRWLECTASVCYEEQFEAKTSKYAEEGTLAHEFCEAIGKLKFGYISLEKFRETIDRLKRDPLYNPDMPNSMNFYGDYLFEKARSTFIYKPTAAFELKVDMSKYVPDCFGTCDCVLVGPTTEGDLLHVVDYKNGKGVKVNVQNNSQMRLYALGALELFDLSYDIKKVSFAIIQPRIPGEIEEEVITVEELLQWAERIKPYALEAHNGPGRFKPGSWCKFCKGGAVCRARAESVTALEAYKDAKIEGRLSAEEKREIANNPENRPVVLSDFEVGDLLIRAAVLESWMHDLEEYAEARLKSGMPINGWKLIEGQSRRRILDVGVAAKRLKAKGFKSEDIYKPQELKSITELETLVGKKDFETVMGDCLGKTKSAPKMVTTDTKGKTYEDGADVDFACMMKGEGDDLS